MELGFFLFFQTRLNAFFLAAVPTALQMYIEREIPVNCCGVMTSVNFSCSPIFAFDLSYEMYVTQAVLVAAGEHV